MPLAIRKNRFVVLAAGVIGCLASLGEVVASRSPVPLAYCALALLVVVLHVSSLTDRVRRMLLLVGIVASAGSLVLMAAKFA